MLVLTCDGKLVAIGGEEVTDRFTTRVKRYDSDAAGWDARDRYWRLSILTYRWPIDRAQDDHMRIETFRRDVLHGAFTDYDGDAYLATATAKSSIRIKPSDLHNVPDNITHIVWSNR